MNRTIMDYVCMPIVLESVSTSVRGNDNELYDIISINYAQYSYLQEHEVY